MRYSVSLSVYGMRVRMVHFDVYPVTGFLRSTKLIAAIISTASIWQPDLVRGIVTPNAGLVTASMKGTSKAIAGGL